MIIDLICVFIILLGAGIGYAQGAFKISAKAAAYLLAAIIGLFASGPISVFIYDGAVKPRVTSAVDGVVSSIGGRGTLGSVAKYIDYKDIDIQNLLTPPSASSSSTSQEQSSSQSGSILDAYNNGTLLEGIGIAPGEDLASGLNDFFGSQLFTPGSLGNSDQVRKIASGGFGGILDGVIPGSSDFIVKNVNTGDFSEIVTKINDSLDEDGNITMDIKDFSGSIATLFEEPVERLISAFVYTALVLLLGFLLSFITLFIADSLKERWEKAEVVSRRIGIIIGAVLALLIGILIGAVLSVVISSNSEQYATVNSSLFCNAGGGILNLVFKGI